MSLVVEKGGAVNLDLHSTALAKANVTAPPMNIQIKLFASLAETRGWREKSLDLAADASVLAAWCLATGEQVLPPRALCAVNMSYCPPETPLKAGDEVAFFPPVTGG